MISAFFTAVLVLSIGTDAFVNHYQLKRTTSPFKASARSAVVMKLGSGAEGLVGSDLELPAFDPLGFTNNQNKETIDWYRAAELKHGRVAMLAALGHITQQFVHLPDPVFSEGNRPWQAMIKVCQERPLAAVQIGLAVFACEALGQWQQAKPGQAPGDLNWDPLNLRPDDEELWEKVQLRELKNGRLAMLAIAAMVVQENISGVGVIEQIREGKANPF